MRHEPCLDNHQDHGRPILSFRRAQACRSSSRPGIPRPSASTRRSRSSPTTRPDATYGQLPGAITCDGGTARDVDPSNLIDRQLQRRAPSIRPPTPESSRSTLADRTAPRLDRTTISCWAAPRATIRATPPRWSSMRRPKIMPNVGNITGSDEVWFNSGDNRYYLGASKMIDSGGRVRHFAAGGVLGVVDGTNVLIETIPQSANSHSVAADSKRNRIFVPQVAPVAVVGSWWRHHRPLAQGICGSSNGCVAVYDTRSIATKMSRP